MVRPQGEKIPPPSDPKYSPAPSVIPAKAGIQAQRHAYHFVPAMNLQRHEELRLPADVEADIVVLLATCFAEADFGGRSYFQNRHHVRFCLYDDNALAGHLALVYRAVRLGDRRLNIVGLAEVAVHPEHRRKGVASRLVDAALDEARAANADAALLFGDQPLYARAGFKTVKNRITLIEMEGARTGITVRETPPCLMVLPLGDLVWDEQTPLDLAGFAF